MATSVTPNCAPFIAQLNGAHELCISWTHGWNFSEYGPGKSPPMMRRRLAHREHVVSVRFLSPSAIVASNSPSIPLIFDFYLVDSCGTPAQPTSVHSSPQAAWTLRQRRHCHHLLSASLDHRSGPMKRPSPKRGPLVTGPVSEEPEVPCGGPSFA